MAPRTRSAASSPTKKTSELAITKIEPKQHDPIKILIAPRNVSPDARVLSIPHPSDGSPKKFLFDPENGLFELKRTIAAPTELRSIIFAPLCSANQHGVVSANSQDVSFNQGFISKEAEMFTATPYDMTFVLLKSIAPSKITTKKPLFQPLEDLIDSIEDDNKHLHHILKHGRIFVQEATAKICDRVQAGDEDMYRYNEDKLFDLIMNKAQCVAKAGLPASLEERFVTRILEAPILSVKREESTTTVDVIQPTTSPVDHDSQDDTIDSQSSVNSAAASIVFSEVSTTTTISTIPEDAIPNDIKHLQRIRTAYNFISATCLPSYVAARLRQDASPKSSTVNFEPLENYLKHLSLLRAEAAASRSISDFSRKRGFDDDEISEDKAEKKRKLEEEEKRKKANESKGVRDLKKVNVTGMKKMSDFFSKKPAVAKTKT